MASVDQRGKSNKGKAQTDSHNLQLEPTNIQSIVPEPPPLPLRNRPTSDLPAFPPSPPPLPPRNQPASQTPPIARAPTSIPAPPPLPPSDRSNWYRSSNKASASPIPEPPPLPPSDRTNWYRKPGPATASTIPQPPQLSVQKPKATSLIPAPPPLPPTDRSNWYRHPDRSTTFLTSASLSSPGQTAKTVPPIPQPPPLPPSDRSNWYRNPDRATASSIPVPPPLPPTDRSNWYRNPDRATASPIPAPPPLPPTDRSNWYRQASGSPTRLHKNIPTDLQLDKAPLRRNLARKMTRQEASEQSRPESPVTAEPSTCGNCECLNIERCDPFFPCVEIRKRLNLGQRPPLPTHMPCEHVTVGESSCERCCRPLALNRYVLSMHCGWHHPALNCDTCSVLLHDNRFRILSGKPICLDCFDRVTEKHRDSFALKHQSSQK